MAIDHLLKNVYQIISYINQLQDLMFVINNLQIVNILFYDLNFKNIYITKV